MKPLRVEQPKYGRSDAISALVEWDSMPGELHPFSASPDDIEAHGRKLFEELKAGAYGDVEPYTDEDAQRERADIQAAKQLALIETADAVIRPLSDKRLPCFASLRPRRRTESTSVG